jgi:MoaA/NifB/PqqE/SkfB family radical SAM enzyme
MSDEKVFEPVKTLWAEVGADGRLTLPAEAAAQYGLRPGARMRIDPDGNALRLHRPVTQLTKIYIEPTDRCNLDCVTCIRNGWEPHLGKMSQATFDTILASLAELDPRPTVFFGGLGEPLFHPRTPEWIAAVHALGCRTEMITNGTLLTEQRSRDLIAAGLDLLWTSIDGATPESYADVRLGAALPQVVANLTLFRKLRKGSHKARPEIGIAFVIMQRNLRDLPGVLAIGRKVGAKHFSISNVLPYTAEMQADRLYDRVVKNMTYMDSPWFPKLSMPRLDLNETTRDAFTAVLNSGFNVRFAGSSLGGANDVCSFIEAGTLSIGWNGEASPCLPLLHTHTTYLHGKPRLNRKHVIGDVNRQSLSNIWHQPEYIAYRERVQRFAFAPCTFCGGCEMSEANEEDCLGNILPACGGCLWAQGVIQCP